MIIAGKNSVYESIISDVNVEKLLIAKNMNGDYVNKIIKEAKKRNIKYSFLNKNIMDKEYKGNHQGIIAHISNYKYYDIDNIINDAKKIKKNIFLILLDGVEDPINFGSILRVSECAGVDGIVIQKHRSVGITDTVMKVSAGALAHIKVSKVNNLNDIIKKLKENNFWIYALEVGGKNIFETNFNDNIALIVGGEGSGIRDSVKKNSDVQISIPLKGKINSLNVSVACGIAIYEIINNFHT